MEHHPVVKALIVFGWSAIKYMVGVFHALLFDVNLLLGIALTVAGGMTGVIFFLYAWDILHKYWVRIFWRKPRKIKINRYRRWLVKFLHTYGLFGIAFLTPVILTVPIGTMMAATIEHNKWKIKRYMLISFINWSVLFLGFFQFFDINVKELIQRLPF